MMWSELLTIIGLVAMAIVAMIVLPDSAKDIALTIAAGLIGYLKGVHDGQKEKGQEIKAD
jgi:hypothetical protein